MKCNRILYGNVGIFTIIRSERSGRIYMKDREKVEKRKPGIKMSSGLNLR